MQTKTTDIAISYDQQLVAEGVMGILLQDKCNKLIKYIDNNNATLEVFDNLKIDIVVFEFAKWPSFYIDYLQAFSKRFPETKILLISELIPSSYLIDVMTFADAYLLRTSSAQKLQLAIREISNGDKYLCSREIEEYVNLKNDNKSELSQREEEVLSNWLVLNDNSEIANKMNISESTVRTHLRNIRKKVNGKNKLELMIYACRNNILKLGMKPVCPNCKFSCNRLRINTQ